MKVAEIGFFTYENGQIELMAWCENRKVVKRTARSINELMKKIPSDIKTALNNMTLYKTREGSRVRGEWYK